MTTARTDEADAPGSGPRSGYRGAMIGGLLVALALSLIAGGVTTAQDSGTPPATGTPAGTPAATPSPDAPRLVLDFTELNDSGVSGEATLATFGDRTIVQIDVEDVAGNHPAHIHEGRCDDIEPEPAFELTNVDREGQSDSVVDVSLDELLDEEPGYVVDIHLMPSELGTLIACAEIEGELTQPGASPTATETAQPTAIDGTGGPGVTTADETPAATDPPTPEVEETPTPEPTVRPTEPAETPEPITGTDEAASGDGTGGIQVVQTPDDTATTVASGKGEPITDGTGGATIDDIEMSGKGESVADGTGGSTQSGTGSVTSGKGVPVGGSGQTLDQSAATVSLPREAGVGTTVPLPTNPLADAIWAS
ncbi:MAG: hypothetical protein H0W06_08845, partial [Chloroflexia bacterium]|nr:hypothetical protein [Chloroflexia bacterium]